MEYQQKKIEIHSEHCIGCGACASECAGKAIRLAAYYEPDKCVVCGACDEIDCAGLEVKE